MVRYTDRPMRRVLLLAVAMLFAALPLSAQGDSESSARDSSNKLIAIQRNWGPRMNTPGASLSLKEVSRGEIAGQRYVGFHLFETGLPKNVSYKVQSLPIDLKLRDLMDGVSFDNQGMAICAGTPGICTGDKPNDDI